MKPLTAIVYASLQQSKVPDIWKAARVMPLFEREKTEDMDNYRPISILPTVSKLLERAVYVQPCDYLRNILNPYQCTEFAALSFADTERRNIDQGQMADAVFIDLRKAFESVNHSLLLKTLYALGIIDQEYGWFTDYLEGRTQVVGFQGAFSDTESIWCAPRIDPQTSFICASCERFTHRCPHM